MSIKIALANLFLAIAKSLGCEDLTGERVVSIQVTKFTDLKFGVKVTDIKTGRWFEQIRIFPSDPLEQEQKPFETLRDYFNHTSGSENSSSNPEIWQKNWDYSGDTIGVVLRQKKAFYETVLSFLKNDPTSKFSEIICRLPPQHMFCRHIAGTWFKQID